MKQQAISLFAWVAMLGTVCFAQQGTTEKAPSVSHTQATAYVRHTKDGDVFVTENASFDFVPLLRDDGKDYTHLRVLHKDHNEWKEGQEGVQGTVTASAWSALSAGNGKPLWTFRAPGNVGQAIPGFRMFRISNWPCCSEPFKNIYFSLLSGKQLYATNGAVANDFGDDAALLRIFGAYDGAHYSQDRYVSFGSVKNGADEPPSIQYGTDTVIKQRFSLIGREYGDNFDVPIFSIVDGNKLVKTLQVLGPFTFSLLLQFPDGPEVRIPIENDVVRADKATLPPGYLLRAESVR